MKQKLEKHLMMTFPEFPEHDGLAHWIEDLAEKEGHYLGLASQHKLSETDLKEWESFASGLRSFDLGSNDDKHCLDYCSDYVRVLSDYLGSSAH